MPRTRRDLVEKEIDRLHEQGRVLERDWRRVPYLIVVGVSAVPAYFVWGGFAALYAVLFAPALVVTAAYLVGVRRSENKQQIEELSNQLRSLAPQEE